MTALEICKLETDRGPLVSQGAPVGGAKEDRTPDLYNAIVALSQLSYGPVSRGRLWGPPEVAYLSPRFSKIKSLAA